MMAMSRRNIAPNASCCCHQKNYHLIYLWCATFAVALAPQLAFASSPQASSYYALASASASASASGTHRKNGPLYIRPSARRQGTYSSTGTNDIDCRVKKSTSANALRHQHHSNFEPCFLFRKIVNSWQWSIPIKPCRFLRETEKKNLHCCRSIISSLELNTRHHERKSFLFAALSATRGGGDGGDDYSIINSNSRPDQDKSEANAQPHQPTQNNKSTDTQNINTTKSHQTSKLESLLDKAQKFLSQKNVDGAFSTLIEAYGLDPTSSKISSMFESCLRLKVELAEGYFYEWKNNAGNSSSGISNDHKNHKGIISEKKLSNLFQDRMGLSTLLIDKEHYDEAGMQLRKAIEEVTFWLNHQPLLQSAPEKDNRPDDKRSSATHSSLSNAQQLQHWQPQIDRAQYLLHRTNAACCKWDTYFEDGDQLRQSLSSSGQDVVRLLHPFDALKFPCISLDLASRIASSYASRALESVGVVTMISKDISPNASQEENARPQRVVVHTKQHVPLDKSISPTKRKIRVGYISPDFTSRHPLAFLMQHVFRYHDNSRFTAHIYSVSSKKDNGPEVKAIEDSVHGRFTYLSPSSMSPMEMYQRMMVDCDIIVDLCGYAGTSVVAEIMASRCRLRQDEQERAGGGGSGNEINDPLPSNLRFPTHVSYMGFPGSVGSSKVWDYSLFDPIVIPPHEEYGIREHYEEALIFMPHCYFVNSHKTVIGGKNDGVMLANEHERQLLRSKYGLHPLAFVYCCHSRPDKIDPTTFRSWMRALSRARLEYFSKLDQDCANVEDSGAPVLWLLRSGEEMEENLRQLVRKEFGDSMDDSIVFADVAERNEHLRRLGCADVFLDTPSYNAHTLGCDALYMGVPMISLLRKLPDADDDDDKCNSFADVDMRVGNDFSEGKSSLARLISTEKLASRVGASLLEAVGLGDLVFPDMSQYEDAMVKCAMDEGWFGSVCERLDALKDSSPLFDTQRWVRNLETAFQEIMLSDSEGRTTLSDIVVEDNDS